MNSDDVFSWSPPPPARKASWSRAAAEKLKERPGDWAMVKSYSTGASARTTAGHIKGGRLAGFPPREYDAVARRRYDSVTHEVGDQWDVYARYVGHLDA